MRIAIFTNNYLPNPFGVAGSIESFRKEFERQGHAVYIFAPETRGYADENPNVFRYKSINLSFKNINFPIAIPFSFKINKILKDLKIDVIHSQHPNLLGWEARRWARKKKIPLIFTWHTLYDQYAHFTPLVPSSVAAWWAIRNAVSYANAADYVVTPTHSVKGIIASWGVTNKHIDAIQTGVEEEIFLDAQREETRIRYGIDDKVVLTLVSRITEEKNILFLMNAVMDALSQNDKLAFLIKGKGSLMDDLLRIKNENSEIGKRIIFSSEDEPKENVFAAGDIFVYASKSETQGMVISEAMYMGLPVVAVKATGIVDLVMNKYSGLLVEEDKQKFVTAVLKLAEDGSMRRLFSENAKRIAKENYVSSVCAKRMLDLYEKAIG